jgi:hypothetical protein
MGSVWELQRKARHLRDVSRTDPARQRLQLAQDGIVGGETDSDCDWSFDPIHGDAFEQTVA